MAKQKPAGWKAFDKLARGLAQVPKEEVDAKITADKAARIKARRKKK
jgi:hypothetical protein